MSRQNGIAARRRNVDVVAKLMAEMLVFRRAETSKIASKNQPPAHAAVTSNCIDIAVGEERRKPYSAAQNNWPNRGVIKAAKST